MMLSTKIEVLIDNKMTVDNLDKANLENNESVSGFISDLKSIENIVKNLKNENNQLKEDFKGAFSAKSSIFVTHKNYQI